MLFPVPGVLFLVIFLVVRAHAELLLHGVDAWNERSITEVAEVRRCRLHEYAVLWECWRGEVRLVGRLSEFSLDRDRECGHGRVVW